MPIFKRIADPKSDPDTFMFDTNPDPATFVEVTPDAPPAPVSTKSIKAEASADAASEEQA